MIEKSPALASPLDFIFATQFEMIGRSFPVESRLNCSAVPLAMATMRCAFRSCSMAVFGKTEVTKLAVTAVPNK